MNSHLRHLARGLRRSVAIIALTLAACAPLGKPTPQPAVYDLGPQATATPVAGLGRIVVRGPSWLNDVGMGYRLLYGDPARRQMFRDSVWAAPPVELMQQAMGRALLDPAGGRCSLQVELDVFGWRFDSASTGRAVVQARLALVEPSGAVRDGRAVSGEAAISGSGAQANVDAMAAALDKVRGQAHDWLVALDRTGAASLNSGRPCR